MLVIYAYGTNCGIRQMISGAHARSALMFYEARRRGNTNIVIASTSRPPSRSHGS
jgi:hypothetical protein